MATLVREAGATSIAQFTVPFKGTWNSMAANMISHDSIYNSLNVFIRGGRLRERPGLTLFANAVFGQPIIGGRMAVTLSGKTLLAISKDASFVFNEGDSNWVVENQIPFATDNNKQISTTFLETANEYVAIIASPDFVLKRWIRGIGSAVIVQNDSLVSGDVPIAKSVCTAASRIVALVDPHTLRWTKVKRYDSWPALAVAKVSQTADAGICVKSLSTLDFVIYKERSIYVAKSQSGTDAQAFNIQFSQTVEGPASVHAVVEAEAVHIYMTKNGRVGLFDGSNKVQWIADGIWLYLQDQIDPTFANKIFGFYDYRLHIVMFYWPPKDQHGLLKGITIINLPLQGSGVEPTPYLTRYVSTAFLGSTEIPCSFGFEQRFNSTIDRALLFTTETPRSCYLDETNRTDVNLGYLCSFQTGLAPLPDMKHYQISVENLFERADKNGQITIRAVTSDMLENPGGLIQLASEQIIDLNNNPVQEYIGFNISTRFFGLQYSWVSSNSKVRWGGTAVYGRTLT